MKLSEGQYCEAQGKEGLGKLSENQNCEAHGKGGLRNCLKAREWVKLAILKLAILQLAILWLAILQVAILWLPKFKPAGLWWVKLWHARLWMTILCLVTSYIRIRPQFSWTIIKNLHVLLKIDSENEIVYDIVENALNLLFCMKWNYILLLYVR